MCLCVCVYSLVIAHLWVCSFDCLFALVCVVCLFVCLFVGVLMCLFDCVCLFV